MSESEKSEKERGTQRLKAREGAELLWGEVFRCEVVVGQVEGFEVREERNVRIQLRYLIRTASMRHNRDDVARDIPQI